MSRSALALVSVALVGSSVPFFTAGCGTARTAVAPERPAGRTCHGPVDIHGQADLGILTGCESIDGDLRITGTTLSSLSGLERIRSVGYLVISDNPSLTSIEGLSGLKSAAGVTINANPRLASLSGLEQVRSLDGLVITGNGVTSLAGLDNLIVTGDLVVVGNPHLASLSGAPRLTAVENLDVEKNPRLTGVGEIASVNVGGTYFTRFDDVKVSVR